MCPASVVSNWENELRKWGHFLVELLNSPEDVQTAAQNAASCNKYSCFVAVLVESIWTALDYLIRPFYIIIMSCCYLKADATWFFAPIASFG